MLDTIFEEIVRQLQTKNGIPRETAEDAVAELLRCLGAKASVEKFERGSSLQMSMPPLLDTAWHYLILNTDWYHWYCVDLLGLVSVLPHTTTTDADDAQSKNERIQTLLRKYQSLFGDHKANLWVVDEDENQPVPKPISECLHRCKDKTTCKHSCCKVKVTEPAQKRRRADDKPDTFCLFIKSLTGSTVSIDNCTAETTILEVKRAFQRKEGVPFDNQRLVYAGAQLEDDRTLASYPRIGPDSILFMVTKLRGC